jgi:hypothetical protein
MIMLFFVFCIGILLGAFVTCMAKVYLFRRLDIIIAPEKNQAHECCKRVMVSTDFNKRDDADKTFVHIKPSDPLRDGGSSKGGHNENAPTVDRPESTPEGQGSRNADIWGPNVSTIKPIDPGRIKMFSVDSDYKIKCKFCLNDIGCQYQYYDNICRFEGIDYFIDKLLVCPCDKLIADKLKNEKGNG